jgi:hypothetical protein
MLRSQFDVITAGDASKEFVGMAVALCNRDRAGGSPVSRAVVSKAPNLERRRLSHESARRLRPVKPVASRPVVSSRHGYSIAPVLATATNISGVSASRLSPRRAASQESLSLWETASPTKQRVSADRSIGSGSWLMYDSGSDEDSAGPRGPRVLTHGVHLGVVSTGSSALPLAPLSAAPFSALEYLQSGMAYQDRMPSLSESELAATLGDVDNGDSGASRPRSELRSVSTAGKSQTGSLLRRDDGAVSSTSSAVDVDKAIEVVVNLVIDSCPAKLVLPSRYCEFHVCRAKIRVHSSLNLLRLPHVRKRIPSLTYRVPLS